MLFKKEVYNGEDGPLASQILSTLEENQIKTEIIHNSASRNIDIPRGVAAGRYGEGSNSLISIYVKNKDYDKATSILHMLK